MKTVEDIKNAVKELQKLGPKVVTVSSANIDEKLEAFVYSVKSKQKFRLLTTKIITSFIIFIRLLQQNYIHFDKIRR